MNKHVWRIVRGLRKLTFSVVGLAIIVWLVQYPWLGVPVLVLAFAYWLGMCPL